MNPLKTAAAKFRTSLSFLSKTATSSNPEVLSATASTDALQGSYTFVVDRLVTSRQLLSRGFADTNSSAAGIDELTFEDWRGRLDRDTSLSLLNDGAGIDRGVLSIDTGSGPVQVDLSRASTASDVLDAINNAGAGVTASIRDGAFVLSSNNQHHHRLRRRTQPDRHLSWPCGLLRRQPHRRHRLPAQRQHRPQRTQRRHRRRPDHRGR